MNDKKIDQNKTDISAENQEKRKIHIGFSHFKSLLWTLISHQIREKVEKLNIDLTISTCSDVFEQIITIESLLVNKIDALLIIPAMSGNPDLIALIKRSRANGIPVIAIGSEIGDHAESGFVASDNFYGSKQITDSLFKSIGERGKVAHLQGFSYLSGHRLRSQAFHEVLPQYPAINLVYEKSVSPETFPGFLMAGKQSTREALQMCPDIKGIVADNDSLALGAVAAIEEAGLSGKINVSGFDGIPGALSAVHSGKLTATIRQSSEEIAQQALSLALKAINNEDTFEKILTPVELLTKDNVLPAISKSLETIPSMLLYIAESHEIQQNLYTEQQSILRFLKKSETRFRNLTALSSDWYWEQDENYKFTFHSGGAADSKPSNTIGKTRWEIPAPNMTPEDWKAHIATLDARLPFYDLVIKRYDPNKNPVYISISGQPMFDENNKFKGYQGIGKNITEQKVAEERIQYLAYHDELTSLANRRIFTQRAKHAITKSKRRGESGISILFIDLDRFKNINDTLGHAAGDFLLREIAKRLKHTLRESDTVARLGGDEFVVLLEDTDDTTYVGSIARKILLNIVQPVAINGQDYQITASIGISRYPADGRDEETLMKNADIAMYMAKEHGKNNYQFYASQMNVHSFERLALESNLRKALENKEFTLHYQEKVSISTNAITGMEALIRWQHPELGMIQPAQFISIAEETGLIVPIGKWVLKTACAQSVLWEKQGLGKLKIAVNLSPRQFNDENLMDDIHEALKETGMQSNLLELEITESTVMYNTNKAIKLMTELKNMSIDIAIDDFGTGYSSLALLKQFPIDTLKIDRSFIKDIPSDTEETAITDAIISMGKALNLKIVAEGVENEEQLDFLREHECDEIQGFYFSKPIPANECLTMLRKKPVPSIRLKTTKKSA